MTLKNWQFMVLKDEYEFYNWSKTGRAFDVHGSSMCEGTEVIVT